jgi:hypothetical protein
MNDSEKLDKILEQQAEILDLLREVKPVQGTRWKEQPIPLEWAEYCSQTRPDLDALLVYRVFQDYWIAKPGKAAVKVNWFTTWKNWVKKQKAEERKEICWRNSDQGIMNKANELGIQARAGESFGQLAQRIEQKLR